MQGSAIGRSLEFDSVPLWVSDVQGWAAAKRTVPRDNIADLDIVFLEMVTNRVGVPRLHLQADVVHVADFVMQATATLSARRPGRIDQVDERVARSQLRKAILARASF